jgi:hypothetical protein
MMKRLMIMLALVALAPIAAHAETNSEAYDRGFVNGYLAAEQVAAQCRMAALDATYPLEPVIKDGCRKIQEAFDKVQKEDREWFNKTIKDYTDFEKHQKNGRQR